MTTNDATYTAIPAGTWIIGEFDRVYATGTTATGIVAEYTLSSR